MLSPLGELVRRHDPDRFFTTLFAPAAVRETLFTLYAFNHELARAREMAREPMMALVRLQWWREVVEGARRRHEVAGPVGDALSAGLLSAEALEGMIVGREAEVDGFATVEEWRAFVLATAGGVAVEAVRAGAGGLPHPDPLPEGEGAVVRSLGAAYGAAGCIRAGRSLPPGGVEVARREGLAWLAAGRVGRRVLVAAYARRDLRRATPVLQRGIGDKLAVLWAARQR